MDNMRLQDEILAKLIGILDKPVMQMVEAAVSVVRVIMMSHVRKRHSVRQWWSFRSWTYSLPGCGTEIAAQPLSGSIGRLW